MFDSNPLFEKEKKKRNFATKKTDREGGGSCLAVQGQVQFLFLALRQRPARLAGAAGRRTSRRGRRRRRRRRRRSRRRPHVDDGRHQRLDAAAARRLTRAWKMLEQLKKKQTVSLR